ncbi:MAG TPA: glycosyltransferase family 39 protein, partial [Ktedonobacterales bacterium]|nr:glycosyltransferase family 39 protein [Ktedonobacterales bacterium]
MNGSVSKTRLRETRKTLTTRLVSAAPPIPGFRPRAEDAFAHMFHRIPRVQLVVAAGLLSTVVYLGFVLTFPITYWWSHPHTADAASNINDMGRITGYSPVAAITFVIAILLLFAGQFFALTVAGKVPQTGPTKVWGDLVIRRAILLFPLVFGAIMVWMQPVTTTDLYGYIARGYLYAHLHQNPMTTPAYLLPGGLTVDRPASPYGPLWLLVTALVSRLAGNDLLANMLAFKFIALAGIILLLWLLDRLALALYPERRLRIAALVGWSPLLIFEAAGNGHNDVVMGVCVLAAFALMLRDKPRSAFAFLVLGALIKYVSAVFVPLWLVYELRRRTQVAVEHAADRRGHLDARRYPLSALMRSTMRTIRHVDMRAMSGLIASVTVIGAVLCAVAYAPFWHGIATFTGIGQQLRPLYYNSSIVGFISGPLQLIVPTSQDAALDMTLRLIFYAIFFTYAYFQTVRLWRVGPAVSIRDVVTAAAKITFAALLLIAFWFQPWYVVWLLPLAALCDEPFVRRQGTILALGALLSYAVGNYLFVNESDFAHDIFVQFFEILVVFAPLLLLHTAPYEDGWVGIVRRYATAIGNALRERAVFWERVMLVLTLIVAVLLRLIRLGNLFGPVPSGSTEADILREASAALRLGLTDPQGLHGPFVALQALLVRIFGQTVFAVLLPAAIFGSLTVLAIYLLTYTIMRLGTAPGKRAIALLAALLAATSHWHVSLSRSGMELVLLPLLMCLALYWLLLALRVPVSTAVQRITPAETGRVPQWLKARRNPVVSVPLKAAADLDTPQAQRRRLAAYIGCGVCTGLACDLAPGLWVVPLTVAGLLGLWRWRRPKALRVSRAGLLAVTGAAVVVGAPAIWDYLSRVVGFPKGSGFLARTTTQPAAGPSFFSMRYWEQVAHNASGVLNLLVTQDYTAGYPAVGGASIVPPLLGLFFYIGLALVLWRWRRFESLALLLLVAMPLIASVAVGTPTGVIEAACVLPAMCILPALGLYEVMSWLGHLPIVLDRINGVRVFSRPEQIGRLLLLGFLFVSTVRTFFWYFEATLPRPPQQYTPSFAGSHVVYDGHSGAGGRAALVVIHGQWASG